MEQVEVVHLSTNMRVHLYRNALAGAFADVLLRIGFRFVGLHTAGV